MSAMWSKSGAGACEGTALRTSDEFDADEHDGEAAAPREPKDALGPDVSPGYANSDWPGLPAPRALM